MKCKNVSDIKCEIIKTHIVCFDDISPWQLQARDVVLQTEREVELTTDLSA